MSNMIRCDHCNRMMFEDSRSEKGDYHLIVIDQSYFYHLCRTCLALFKKDFLHMIWDEDDEEWREE